MRAATRYKLHFGPYHSPRMRLGAIVKDELRGKVHVVGFSDARIAWPIVLKNRSRSYGVFGSLAKAVRRESAIAVMHWFGVSRSWVRMCRRALKVPAHNEGTQKLRIKYAHTPAFRETARKGWAKAGDPRTPRKNWRASLARSGRRASARRSRPRCEVEQNRRNHARR